jgi:hypothetical protein
MSIISRDVFAFKPIWDKLAIHTSRGSLFSFGLYCEKLTGTAKAPDADRPAVTAVFSRKLRREILRFI